MGLVMGYWYLPIQRRGDESGASVGRVPVLDAPNARLAGLVISGVFIAMFTLVSVFHGPLILLRNGDITSFETKKIRRIKTINILFCLFVFFSFSFSSLIAQQ